MTAQEKLDSLEEGARIRLVRTGEILEIASNQFQKKVLWQFRTQEAILVYPSSLMVLSEPWDTQFDV